MTAHADIPEVACSLSNEEIRARRALARKTLVPHIIESQEIERGLRLTFSESDEVRANVETFASLERQCCGFLTFSITPPGEALTLTIEGPPEAAAIIESFIEQIQGH
ncbi:MAG: hypothetical protein O7F71_05055 [Gammaproteobacteria bacterium]|nr:hypothetical protein [Gammaproteobacteria bacterium]